MLLSVGLVLTLGGFVSDTPRAATLIDREFLAQIAPPPPPPAPPPAVPSLQVETLRAQLEQLKANEPGVAGSVVLLVSGVLVAVAGAVFAYVGLIILAFTGSPVILLPALLGMVLGIGMSVGGGVWLGSSIRAKNRHKRDVRALEQQIELLERPAEPLQPPALPPPSVQAPAPTLLLATF